MNEERGFRAYDKEGYLMRSVVKAICFGIAGVILAGCATSSRDEMSNAVFTTQTSVKKLEKDLSASVTKLNETAADLTARVNEGDRQNRELKTLVEESQVKLDQIQSDLERLTGTLYKYLNLTPESGGFSAMAPEVSVDAENSPAGFVGLEPITPVEETGTQAQPPQASSEPKASSDAQIAGPLATYQAAQKSYSAQDYEGALRQYQDYLKQYPDTEYSAFSTFWIGMCQFRLEQYEESITTFEALRKEYPTSTKVPLALNNQAAAHLVLGQKERAKELLEDLVKNYPMSPAAERARTRLEELAKEG